MRSKSVGVHAAVLPAYLILAACGGGGGSGGAPTPTVPPPSPPPSSPPPFTQFPVNELGQNGDLYLSASTWRLTQGSLHIAGISARAFDSRSGGAPSLPCSQGGQIRTTLTDTDSSGGVTATDHVVATLDHCRDNDVEANGTLDITVVSVDSLAPERRVRLSAQLGSVTLLSGGETLPASGTVVCLCARSALQDRLLVTGNDFAIVRYSNTMRLTNSSIDYAAEYEQYTHQYVMSGRVEDGDRRQYFEFDTDAPLYGRIGRPVEAGALSFHVGSNATLRFEEGLERTTNAAGGRADLDGDGDFETPIGRSWFELMTLGLFEPLRDITIPDNLPGPNEVVVRTISLTSSGTGPLYVADLAVDTPRDRLYVSVPGRNEVAVLSTTTYHVVDRIPVGSRPTALSLSRDGTTLYAALSQGGAVAALNLTTRTVTRLETAAANGSGYIDNVVESSGRVYSTARPQTRTGNPTDAFLARTDMRNGGLIERVTDSQVFRVPVPLAAGPAADFVYAALPEDSGSKKLLKLDQSQSAMPVVLTRDFPSGTELTHLTLSPDGSKILLDSGEMIRTSDFQQAGSIINGEHSVFTADGQWILDGLSLLYDAATLIIHRPFDIPCAIATDSRVVYVAAHAQFVATQYNNRGGDLCVFQLSNRLKPPGTDDPASELPLEPATVALPVTPYASLLNAEVRTAAVDRTRGYVYATGNGTGGLEFGVGRLSDGALLHRQIVPGNIQLGRIVLNDDGSRVYILQSGAGTNRLEVFDPTALSLLAPVPFDASLLTVPGSPNMGSARDMVWIGNDQVLLSAVGTFSDLTYATRIDVTSGVGQRIAGGVAKFPAGAELIGTPDGTGVIMAGSNKQLVRVNLRQADPDVIADRTHDELIGTANLEVSADGTTVYGSEGAASNATTFQLRGLIPRGIPVAAPDESAVFVLGLTDNSLRVLDPATFQVTAVHSIPGCGPGPVTDAMSGTTPRSVVFVKGGIICQVAVP
ncbi:MAG: YncE family protein [Pseudomonadota bacterium]